LSLGRGGSLAPGGGVGFMPMSFLRIKESSTAHRPRWTLVLLRHGCLIRFFIVMPRNMPVLRNHLKFLIGRLESGDDHAGR
jgi:hypothetical protein